MAQAHNSGACPPCRGCLCRSRSFLARLAGQVILRQIWLLLGHNHYNDKYAPKGTVSNKKVNGAWEDYKLMKRSGSHSKCDRHLFYICFTLMRAALTHSKE
ncbi:hypothetical protein EJB05_57104 [Eragrostis curvula]|uniref:Uncharacterized protein n=1 Tax=Eragrostis curvula TaxID=38414 RepID=A0A5J9SEB4_9POAL|nr:hypothetical protein EJB05_57104 [Eragrostis curvula]